MSLKNAVWVALAHVRPMFRDAKTQVPGEIAGAYMNVAGLAHNASAFRDAVAAFVIRQGFYLVSLECLRSKDDYFLGERSSEIDDLIISSSQSGTLEFGVAFSYGKDDS